MATPPAAKKAKTNEDLEDEDQNWDNGWGITFPNEWPVWTPYEKDKQTKAEQAAVGYNAPSEAGACPGPEKGLAGLGEAELSFHVGSEDSPEDKEDEEKDDEKVDPKALLKVWPLRQETEHKQEMAEILKIYDCKIS